MIQSENEEFLNINNYDLQRKIGEGSFGEVFIVVEKSSGNIYAAKISLKKLNKDKKSLLTNLSREVNIISQLNHPSILKFIGFSPIDFNQEPNPVIITEYSSNDTLLNVIKLERQSLSPETWNDTKRLINIYGIASAMSYLHAHNIIHRDLKPANILEDDYLFPKIADFGLSKVFHQNKDSFSLQSSIGIKGTPIYIPPETWQSNEYTKYGDVYAFSIIVYELMTLEEPYKDFTIPILYSKVVQEGYRPEFKNPIPECYHNLITKCWSNDPEKRPTFEQIVFELKNNRDFIIDSIDEDEYLDYIDLIDNYQISFNPRKKFKKISFLQDSLKISENKWSTLILKELIKIENFNKLPEATKEFFNRATYQNKTIIIHPDDITLLFAYNSLSLPDFKKVLEYFDKIIIQIQYPSNIFEQLFNFIAFQLSQEIKSIQIVLSFSDIKNIKFTFGDKFPPLAAQIQNSITSIEKQAFKGFSFLKEIVIPSSVSKIDDEAFCGCKLLNEIEIPSSVKIIGKSAFQDCISLKKILIPSSVTEKKSNAFNNCLSLVQISIPSTIVIIESNIFFNCTKLDTIFIPDSIISIGCYAFSQCFSLKNIYIPSSVAEIGSYAFYKCTSLQKVTFQVSFDISSIEPYTFAECTSLKSIAIPSYVTIIKKCAFLNCHSLMRVYNSESLSIIEESAFQGCSLLKEIDIPRFVTTIDQYAFSGCCSLISVIIPPSVVHIGKSAFSGCSNLKSISNYSSFKKTFMRLYLGLTKSSELINYK